MKQAIFALILMTAATVAPAAGSVDTATGIDTGETLVLRVFYDTREQLDALATEKALWQVDRRKGFVLLEGTELDKTVLAERGYRVAVDVARTQRYNAAMARVRTAAKGGSGIPGFPCYRTVEETYATAEAIVAANPDLAQWIDIGDSWEKTNGLGGDDLRVLKLTNAAIGGDKPKLFAMTAIHAREYTTAELNTRFAEYLVNNYGVDADVTWILDHHEVHLSLQSNPDGREQAQTGLSWRKNTNQNYCGSTSNLRGADLNRNFPFQWGCCGGSSSNQCSEVYRGPIAQSEPESAAIIDYVRSIFPDQRGDGLSAAAPADATGVFLDIHSFSELVIWPWGFSGSAAPNASGLQTLGRRFAWFNDYEPAQATVLGITDGTTDDFAYGELGLAAYTFELGTSFFQSCGAFESSIFPDNLQALIYAARVARAPYLLPSGPDALDVALSTAVVSPGDVVTLTATIDDTRFSNNNGVEPRQDIAAAAWYLDVPPWSTDPLPAPVAMAAVDGSYDEQVEAVTAQINTAALANGRHTIYVQGTDASGQPGPVSAAFLYVLDPAAAPAIEGTIVAADTGEPLAATVSAGQFSTTTDPADGSYRLTVIAGDYEVTVAPDAALYGSVTAGTVAATAGETTTLDVALTPFCAVFADDVESGNVGWTAQAPWAITTELANSPTHSWTDSPGGNHANNRDVSLTSPVLDLTGLSDVRLGFAQICDTEATYDFCNVEISTGGGWTPLATYDGLSSSWEDIELDAGQLAGSATAQFRFRFTSDFSITEDGWHVDDIVVTAAGPACLGVDSDADGVADSGDNCRLEANTNQRDTDGDGFGNLCDADLDNSGFVNFGDLALFKERFLSDDADADFDGDGSVNFGDLAIIKARFLGAPGPGELGAL